MNRPGASRDRQRASASVTVPVLIASTVAVAALILVLELFVPPAIGIANNGDFEKVMTYVRLQYLTENPEEKYWTFVVTEFGVSPVALRHSGYHTSEIFLAAASRALAAPISPRGRFDIRALGAVHVLLLLAGIALLGAAGRPAPGAARAVVAFLSVFFFTDVGYAAPLNSFYSQASSLLFLLLTAGVAGLGIARGRLSGLLLPLYFLFAGLFVVSKPQECLHGPLLAGLGLLLASGGTPEHGRRRLRMAGVLAIGLVAGSAAYYETTPREDIHDVGLYHSVFMDLLPTSPDPGRDLDDLGLDRSLLRYSGRHAYLPDSPLRNPTFRKQFFEQMGYARLMLFYGRHPARLLERTRRAARDAAQMRPLFGNFEKKYGFPPATRTKHFDWWSTPKSRTRPYALPLFAAFFAATLTACAVRFRDSGPRERLFRVALAVLVVMALLEFFVCAFADFLVDLPRHLYSFHAMADLVLMADLAWIAQRVSAGISRRRGGAGSASIGPAESGLTALPRA